MIQVKLTYGPSAKDCNFLARTNLCSSTCVHCANSPVSLTLGADQLVYADVFDDHDIENQVYTRVSRAMCDGDMHEQSMQMTEECSYSLRLDFCEAQTGCKQDL